jgi:hypothetical protein
MQNLFLIFILTLFLSPAYQREEIIKTYHPLDHRGDIVIAFGNDYLIEEPIKSDIIDSIKIKKPNAFVFVGHVPLPKWGTAASFNTLPSDFYVTGVFYQDEYEDYRTFYQYSKETLDSYRWKAKSSYWSFLIKAPESKFPIGRYVKVILLDLELNFAAESGKKELEWLDRELASDSSIVMYIFISNLQIFSLGKLYEIEIDDELRITLMQKFMKVNQPILFASTVGLGPYGEIINYPCQDMYRKVVEISSRGMNADPIPRFEMLNKMLVPEISSKKSDRIFVNNYGTIDIHLEPMELDKSYVYVRLLSDKNDVLRAQRLEFKELKKDLRKPFDNLKCTKDLVDSIEKEIVKNLFRNPYFWISFLSMLIPPMLIFWTLRGRMRGGNMFGGGIGGGGEYGGSSGGGWALARTEFEAFHGAY